MPNIIPIHAFVDNYIWLIQGDDSNKVWAVDPGEATGVLDYLKQNELELEGILITHHHMDHTGGVADLVNATHCQPIVGPDLPCVNKTVKAGDTIHLKGPNIHLDVIEVPGHTLDHLAFVGEGILLCGDTLFAGGCGRLFEGTAQQMYDSLYKLKALPDDTLVYCTHEYTLNNLEFAITVEADNDALIERLDDVKLMRAQNQITLPTTIALEKATNPFLRTQSASIHTYLQQQAMIYLEDEVAVLAALRQLKDNW